MLISARRQERVGQIAYLSTLPLGPGRIAAAEVAADMVWSLGLPAVIGAAIALLGWNAGWLPTRFEGWPLVPFVWATAWAVLCGRGNHDQLSVRTALAGICAATAVPPFARLWIEARDRAGLPSGAPVSVPLAIVALVVFAAATAEMLRWRAGDAATPAAPTKAGDARTKPSRPAPLRPGRWITRFGLLSSGGVGFFGGAHAAIGALVALLAVCWAALRPPHPFSAELDMHMHTMFAIMAAGIVGGAVGHAALGPPIAFFATRPIALRRHRLVAVALGIGVSMLLPMTSAIGTHTMSDRGIIEALVKSSTTTDPRKLKASVERTIERIIGRRPPPDALVPNPASKIRYVVSAPTMKAIRRGLLQDIARSAARALVFFLCVAVMSQTRLRIASVDLRAFLLRRNLLETAALVLVVFVFAGGKHLALPLWADWLLAMAVLAGFWTAIGRRDLV